MWEKQAKGEEDSVWLRMRWNPKLIRDISSVTCITSLEHSGNNHWMLAGVVLRELNGVPTYPKTPPHIIPFEVDLTSAIAELALGQPGYVLLFIVQPSSSVPISKHCTVKTFQ